jgi:hypothetical protein
MARFFIDRPVLAMVLSIVITLLGGLSIFALPIAQYPNVVPPVVNISATYLGGSAADIEKAVAQPLEAQLVSLDDMIYMSATMGTPAPSATRSPMRWAPIRTRRPCRSRTSTSSPPPSSRRRSPSRV